MRTSKPGVTESVVRRIAEKRQIQEVVAMLEALASLPPCRIGFVGEWNAGKSSVINAFVGRRLLPAMDVPTTRAITEIEVGEALEHPSYFEMRDSVEIPIGAADFGEIATGRRAGTVLVRVPPGSALPVGLRLVDTPGLDSLDAVDADFTCGYLPFLDGFVLCHDLMRGELFRSELGFLARPEVRALRAGMLVVLTRADASGKTELEEKVRAIAMQLKGQGLDADRVVAVSTTQVLDATPPAFEHLSELQARFETYFVRNRAALLEARRESEVRAAGHVLALALRERRQAFALDDSQFSVRETAVNAEIRRLDDARADARARLETWSSELHAALRTSANSVLPNFKNARSDVELQAAGQRLAALLGAEIDVWVARYGAGLIMAPALQGIGGLTARLEQLGTWVDRGVTIVTMVATAVVSAGASLGANAAEGAGGGAVKVAGDLAVKRGATAVARAGWLAKGARFLGTVIKEVNPLEHAGAVVRHVLVGREVERTLPEIAREAAELARRTVEDHLQREVFGAAERDLSVQRAALAQVTVDRAHAIETVVQDRVALDNDLAALEQALLPLSGVRESE